MSMIRCPICGEEFSDTYKECPFCAEEEAAAHGQVIHRTRTGHGRRLNNSRRRNSGAGGVMLLLTAVIIVGVVVFTAFGKELANLVGIRDPVNKDKDPVGTSDTSKQPVGDDDNSGTDTDDPNLDQPPVEPGPLTLDQADFTIDAGQPVRLSITGGNGTVVWTSSNEHIATVADGVVTGVAGGTATITATSGEETASVNVTINGDPWVSNAKLSLSHTDVTINSTDPVQYFRLKVKGTDSKPTWSVDKEGIVTIAEDGTVTRVKKGTVTITVSVDGQKLTCIVRCH